MVKRLTTVLLCLCLVFFSVPVYGDVVEGFAVRVLEGDEEGFTYNAGVLAFTNDGSYEVSMVDRVDVTDHRIVIEPDVNVELTIKGLNVERNDSENLISVGNKSSCDLSIIGENSLKMNSPSIYDPSANAVIHVAETGLLTIDGEGALDVRNEDGAGAAIGSNVAGDCGEISINGGTISVKSSYGAGIGSGQGGYGGTIRIEGGDVSASSYAGAGIGSGESGTGGSVSIEGGTIRTNASLGAGIGSGSYGSFGNITIDGGYINAISNQGAGIGGGNFGDCSDIAINNGNITASSYEGAGIGGGASSNVSNISITINSGVISASSSSGAGIGGGKRCSAGNITINGGIITASSHDGAGIGSGFFFSDGTVSITGGTISAESTGRGAGIGGGYRGHNVNVYISGGTVFASTASAAAETIGHGEPYYTDSLNSGVLLDRPDGSPVYLTEFDTGFGEAANLADGDLVCGGAAAGYGTGSLITDEDGKLYFYLPAGLAAARFSNNTYIADIKPAGVNSFQPSPERTTAAGTKISTLPYFNAAAVSYTNPRFSAGSSEKLLTTAVSGALPVILAKMDNTVYPEPVSLSASILDASTPSGMDAIEAIDRAIASALTEIAPNPAILAKAEQLLVLDLALRLESDGSDVQPLNGNVTISLPVPEGYDPDNIMLAHLKSDGSSDGSIDGSIDGTIEFMDITIENGWITFSTDSFSNYIVLELDMPLAEFIPPPPTDDQGETSGDNGQPGDGGGQPGDSGAGDSESDAPVDNQSGEDADDELGDSDSGGGAPQADNDDKSAGTGTFDRAEDDKSTGDSDYPADRDQMPNMGENHAPFKSAAVLLLAAVLIAVLFILKRKVASVEPYLD